MPSLATATDAPNLQLLLEEFKRSGITGDYFNRVRTAEDTRLARWDSQSDDGRKWDKNQPEGQPAFPWEGASDVRCYQSDEVVNFNVNLKTTAFWRAELRASGTTTATQGAAAQATTFMDWLVHQHMAEDLEREVELSAQYEEWYGWTACHNPWRQEIGYKNRKVNLDQLEATAAQLRQVDPSQVPPEQAQTFAGAAVFADLIKDPALEDQAVEVAQLLYRALVEQELPEELNSENIRDLSKARARKEVRNLRETGAAVVPMPYLCKNEPAVMALKPWRDVVFPFDTTDVQSARVIFIRQYLNEADVRAMRVSADWNEEWIEEAVKTKGKLSTWSFQDGSASTSTSTAQSWQWAYTDSKTELIEVVWAYHRAVDEDGVSGVYYTVFSPHVTNSDGASAADLDKLGLVADFALLDQPDYPVVVARRELLDRQLLATRGVPEILLTSQREEKVQRDALMDLSSIGVLPPVNVYKGVMGKRYKFGPAAQNEVTVAGKEPKFMEVPTQGAPLAIEYMTLLDVKKDRYFGAFAEHVPPALNQVIMEPKVRKFLRFWANNLMQVYQSAVRYAPQLIERVTGYPLMVTDPDSVGFTFMFHFDVAQLNPDLMEKKLKSFSELLPEDAAGVIDRAKLIQAKARMIDPMLAKELVQDQGPASQRMFNDVKGDIIGMSDGNEANYADASNDPAAPMKLNFTKQIVGANVKYVTRLAPELLAQLFGPQAAQQAGQMGGSQVDPIFSNLLAKYLDNLQQGVDQQQNKQIGRLGVKPMAMGQ